MDTEKESKLYQRILAAQARAIWKHGDDTALLVMLAEVESAFHDLTDYTYPRHARRKETA